MISGGSRGLGRTLAEQFLSYSAHVIILDIIEPEPSLYNDVEFFKIDFNDIGAIEKFVSEHSEIFRSIDMLVNNARGARVKSGLEETAKSLQDKFAVGVTTPMLLAQAFINARAFEQKKPGTIVNISSISAQRVSDEPAGYHIAKAGIESLTRYLAVHGGKYQVRVNAVAPGFIVQPQHLDRYYSKDNEDYRRKAESAHPIVGVGFAQDVANLVMFLSSEMAKFMTGQVLVLDGGLGLRDGWAQANIKSE